MQQGGIQGFTLQQWQNRGSDGFQQQIKIVHGHIATGIITMPLNALLFLCNVLSWPYFKEFKLCARRSSSSGGGDEVVPWCVTEGWLQ